MRDRVITGVVLALTVLLAIWSRELTLYIFDLFVGMVSVVAIIEVARVLERRQIIVNPIVCGCYPAVLFVGLAIGLANKLGYIYYFAYFLISLVAMFLINFLVTLCVPKVTNREKERYGVYGSNLEYAFQKAMNSELVLLYPGLLAGLMFVLNHIMEFKSISSNIIGGFTILATFFIILTFVVTIFTDTFALFTGRLIGGRKLCPKISPNKTIAGAVGGLIFAVIGGIAVFYLFHLFPTFMEAIKQSGLQFWHIIIVSFVGSICGQCGDIVASMLKRSSRVKDYGALLPGHGGVMDRVDGLLFVIPVVTLFAFIILL